MSVRFRKVARDLLGNPARTILVIAAIAVGLIGLSTTLRARAIFTANLEEELAASNPSSATILTEGATDAAVIAVAARADVDDAQGALVAFGRIRVGDDLRPLRLVVVNDLADRTVDRLRPDFGSWPPPLGSIALERSSIDAAGLEIGDTASIVDPGGSTHEIGVSTTVYDLTIVSGRLVDQVIFAYASTATWQQLGLPGGFNEISFTVKGDRADLNHVGEVAELAAETLTNNGFERLGTRIPTPSKHVLDNVISSLLLILGTLGVLSLVLSGFLVFNTVSAMLARQEPQIGVMKAVGATRRAVLTIYLTTVVAFSLIALIVAVPVGALAARLLVGQLATLLNIDIHSFGAPPWVWLTELSIGLGVPTAAALAPILSGTRATVAEAIRGKDPSGGFGPGRIDRGLARLQWLSGSLRYAARNTFRRKLRLTLTVITLSLGGAILVTVLTLRSSLLASVESIAAYWQQDVTIDLQQMEPFGDLEEIVGATDGVKEVEGWLVAPSSVVRANGQAAGEETTVFGIPPDSLFIDPTLREGRWLRPDDDRKVVINVDVAANEPEISVGDQVVLRVLGVDAAWQVVGISTTQLVAPGEPRPSAPIAYVPYRAIAAAVGPTQPVNRLVVSGTPDDAEAQTDLAEALDAELGSAGVGVRAVEIQSRMREQVERLTTPILILLAAMAGLFGLVGGLGLLGTMSLNVLERTTEFGVLRAVGATGRSVLSIVLVEGLTVAALSWLLGSVVAVPLSWVMGRAVGVSFIKVPLDFHFAPFGVVLWFGMAFLLAIVSSWMPARNASRLSVRDAIAYE
ncbi:MAG TPA: ABC transporter permease [Acidimicrobiia bacterium]|nr:ABC transporter permease [Acidimicrobiia bacterium]